MFSLEPVKGRYIAGTLSLSQLLSSGAISESHFTNHANLLKVIVKLQSQSGSQEILVPFTIPESYTGSEDLTSAVFVDPTAYDDFTLSRVILADKQGDLYTISAADLQASAPSVLADFNVTFTSTESGGTPGPNSGGGTGFLGLVAPGVYETVTVDALGRVISGSSPTTLVGYGITDAVKNEGGVPSIKAGTELQKSILVSPAVGMIFIATDTGVMYLRGASSWVEISGGSAIAAAEASLADAIAAEQSARIAADVSESTARAMADNTESAARQAADASLAAAIDAEASARQAAIGAALTTAISDVLAEEQSARIAADVSESTARAMADNNEAQTRAAADASLDAAIISLSADLEDKLDAERIRASASESNISAQISSLESYLTGNDTSLAVAIAAEVSRAQAAEASEAADRAAAVAAETSRATAAEASLNSKIDGVISNVDPATLDSLSEVVAAFQAADGSLQGAISALGTGATSALGTQVTALEAADTSLADAIAAEQTARANAVTAEQSARSAADTSLAAAISSETNRAQAAELSLASSVTTETLRAQAAEASLASSISSGSSAIAAETSRAQAAEASLASTINTVSGGAATSSPTGILLPYAGSSAPTGWLLCYGQAVSRTTYAGLFAVVGTTYGIGDNSTTFNLPDLRGRIPVGVDNMGGVAASRMTTAGSGVNGTTLGATGGSETHTLTAAQMPSHTHTQNAHTHEVRDTSNRIPSFGGGSIAAYAGNVMGGTSGGSTISAISSTATNQNTGGGAAHNNTQPSIVLNYIIKY